MGNRGSRASTTSIVHASASLVREQIVADIGNQLFMLLVDKARDESTKEQMSIVVRFLDKTGRIQECFLDVVHVNDTKSETLFLAIKATLNKYGLLMSRVRGQGYDGASNMCGELNGLKALILNENKGAHYIHCFAHRLQLALVGSAKNNLMISRFFDDISAISVTVGSSCKWADQMQQNQILVVQAAIQGGNLETGRGINQEMSLRRPGDMRWSLHFTTICRIIDLFDSVVQVLESIMEDANAVENCGEASRLLDSILRFDFAFMLHLMKLVLGKSVVL